MMGDLTSGEIDVAILWGPMAGYYARLANPQMRVTLLMKDTGGPQLAYRIAMGVRATDQNWKRLLNRLIAEKTTGPSRPTHRRNDKILRHLGPGTGGVSWRQRSRRGGDARACWLSHRQLSRAHSGNTCRSPRGDDRAGGNAMAGQGRHFHRRDAARAAAAQSAAGDDLARPPEIRHSGQHLAAGYRIWRTRAGHRGLPA